MLANANVDNLKNVNAQGTDGVGDASMVVDAVPQPALQGGPGEGAGGGGSTMCGGTQPLLTRRKCQWMHTPANIELVVCRRPFVGSRNLSG